MSYPTFKLANCKSPTVLVQMDATSNLAPAAGNRLDIWRLRRQRLVNWGACKWGKGERNFGAGVARINKLSSPLVVVSYCSLVSVFFFL